MLLSPLLEEGVLLESALDAEGESWASGSPGCMHRIQISISAIETHVTKVDMFWG